MSRNSHRSPKNGYLVITRPANVAQSFASLLNSNVKTLIAPALEYSPLRYSLPSLERCDRLVFTSAQAVKIFARHTETHNIPVLVVGPQTAETARACGYKHVKSANGNVHDLVHTLKTQKQYATLHNLLYVSGKQVTGDLKKMLNGTPLSVSSLCVYDMKFVKELPIQTIQAFENKKINSVCFFSKRSAQAFLKQIGRAKLTDMLQTVKALCISTSVLECVQVLRWKNTYTCKHPDRDHMIKLIHDLY